MDFWISQWVLKPVGEKLDEEKDFYVVWKYLHKLLVDYKDKINYLHSGDTSLAKWSQWTSPASGWTAQATSSDAENATPGWRQLPKNASPEYHHEETGTAYETMTLTLKMSVSHVDKKHCLSFW